MKKLLALLLCLTLLLAGCGTQTPEATEPVTEPAEEIRKELVITPELAAKLDAVLEEKQYEGIVSLTLNGERVYQWAKGTDDLDQPLTVDSPMLIGSVSKQFCAAAILMLRDQGKLNLEDTLEKYFPEFIAGKDITLHQLLSMQSGLPRDPMILLQHPELYVDQSAAENQATVRQWVFEQPLQFTPGTQMAYSNINYSLLSAIVEQISGSSYTEFIRQNIFEPLGMTQSGFTDDLREAPQWSRGLSFEKFDPSVRLAGIVQGCGDIVTTAGDMELWQTALESGKVIGKESFLEMADEHTPGYGYGLEKLLRGGWGHGGNIGDYSSYNYSNQEYGFHLYMVNNKTSIYRLDLTDQTKSAILRVLFEAADAEA